MDYGKNTSYRNLTGAKNRNERQKQPGIGDGGEADDGHPHPQGKLWDGGRKGFQLGADLE